MTNVHRIRLTPDERLDERISVAALHEAFQGVVPEDDEERVYLIVPTGFGRLRGTSEDVVEAASGVDQLPVVDVGSPAHLGDQT